MKLTYRFSLVAIATLIILAVIAIRSVNATVETEKPRLTVSVQTVTKQPNYRVLRYFPATAEAQQTVSIGSEIAGKMIKVFVDDGDLVNQGQPLFELDTQLLQTQKEALTAQLESLKPELALISKRLVRQRNLKQQSFSSEDSIDALEARSKATQANMRSLEAQITDTEIRLSKATVYAPFAASVQRRLLDEGAVIAAGTPVLNMVGAKVKEIITGLPAQVVSGLTKEATYTVVQGTTEVPVKLQRILPEINPITQTQGVKFLADDNATFTASEYLRLALETSYDVEGFWLPNTALVEGPRGLWEIFVVTKENRVKKYTVSIVYPSNPASFVSTAIPDGSQVVVEGVHRLAQNVEVNVQQRIVVADNESF